MTRPVPDLWAARQVAALLTAVVVALGIFFGVPSFMMWDDHEVCNDWSGGRCLDGSGGAERYAAARAALDAYQGSHNPPPRVAGELYYSFRAGPADFYVLDTRSYRSANNVTDNSSKTMLGATQKADLKAWLSSSTAPFKFLVSSVPWHNWAANGNGYDSWKSFSTERNELFRYIRDNRIRGVVLISGDQHWSGAFGLTGWAPYVFYEFMPTPIWANTFAGTISSDPQILFKISERKVYGVFDVDAAVGPARLTVEFFGTTTNASLYRLTITDNDTLPS